MKISRHAEHQWRGIAKRAGRVCCPITRGLPITEIVWVQNLFQLGRYAVELAVQGRTNRVDRCNDHDRNAGSDQAVFNRGGARIIFQKRSDLGHVTGSLLVDVAMEVQVRSWNRLKPGRCN